MPAALGPRSRLSQRADTSWNCCGAMLGAHSMPVEKPVLSHVTWLDSLHLARSVHDWSTSSTVFLPPTMFPCNCPYT